MPDTCAASSCITGLSYTKSQRTRKQDLPTLKEMQWLHAFPHCPSSEEAQTRLHTQTEPQQHSGNNTPRGSSIILLLIELKHQHALQEGSGQAFGEAVILGTAAQCPSLACWVLRGQLCHIMARGPAYTTASWAAAHPSNSRVIHQPRSPACQPRNHC